MMFADPGKFQFYTCDQLNAAARGNTDRERDLRRLIDKAAEGSGGAVVGAMAYRTDYIAVTEELRLIEATARAKNCVTPSTWQSNSVIR